MGNFYNENPDLKRRIAKAPWASIIPPLEKDFTETDEMAPANLEDAVEQIGMVLEMTGEMAAEEFAPHAAEVDKVGARLEDGRVVYPEAMQRGFKLISEAGLMGLTIPREYGGMNLPATAYTATVEMIGRADAALMTLYCLQGCSETIHAFGSEELKTRYLPPLCSGEITACMALTEPNAGSELGAVSVRAVEQEGGWRLSGQKCFITNGGAEVLLTLARSETDKPGGAGLSMYLVESGKGVEVAKLEDKLGIHGSATAVVNYDDALGELMGRRGGGLYECTLSLLHSVRLEIASQAVGIAQDAQAQSAQYASEREQFKRSIDRFAPVRNMLFENAVQIEAARAIVMNTAALVDHKRGLERTGGDAAAIEKCARLAELMTPLSKYYACEIVNDVTMRAIQIHGGYGYTREYPVERNMRDGRICNIYEGTSEIQVGAMIVPLLKGGLPLLFEESLAEAKEPASCSGVLDTLRDTYTVLCEAGEKLAAADKLAQQGWARPMADATSDLMSALIFLSDAVGDDRSAVLARYQADAALRCARSARDAVRDDKRASFDDDTFDAVVVPYRSGA
jgi:alkylation response protein AidB-like acyl-CoA dehydrogenase